MVKGYDQRQKKLEQREKEEIRQLWVGDMDHCHGPCETGWGQVSLFVVQIQYPSLIIPKALITTRTLSILHQLMQSHTNFKRVLDTLLL